MIDIKFLRENPDLVRASQKGRGEDPGIVDQVIAIDDIHIHRLPAIAGISAPVVDHIVS